MLLPIISLILGILLLFYAFLFYTGNNFVNIKRTTKRQKYSFWLVVGYILIALSLISGIFGYFKFIDGILLRYLRIVFTSIGFLLIGSACFKICKLEDLSFARLKREAILQWKYVQRYWDLTYILVHQNLKVRYRGSFFGVYWSLLNPLVMMVIYAAIFGTQFSSYYNNSVIDYVLAAFTGLVITNFYSAATSQALQSVVGNGIILNKIKLPVSVFPVSIVAANVFQFSVSILPLLVVITFINSRNILNIIMLVFPILSLALISIGVSFLVSALFVFFRDLTYFYELVCFIVWISCPVFYPLAIVPKQIQTFLFLNPLVPIIESLRQISLSGQLPRLDYIEGALFSSFIFLFIGWFSFQKLKPNFIDLL
jgi:lipopolysaccharide transport system permease protein